MDFVFQDQLGSCPSLTQLWNLCTVGVQESDGTSFQVDVSLGGKGKQQPQQRCLPWNRKVICELQKISMLIGNANREKVTQRKRNRFV